MSSEPKSNENQDPRGKRKREKILRALSDLGGKANTSEIKSEVRFGSNKIRYHCGVLENERTPPEVEYVGEERGPKGRMDTNIYRLTERGHEVVEAMDASGYSIGDAESFADLREENRRLKERVEQVEDAHDNLIEAILEGKLDEHLDGYLDS